MHNLHLKFDHHQRSTLRPASGHTSPSMMDMLQWVLHGVEDAVQVITIGRVARESPPMFSFNMNSSQRMGAEDGRFFSQLTHLRSLRLDCALANIHTMACPLLQQCLINLPQLHDLVLSCNSLDAKDLEALEPAWRHLPALQSLDLGGNAFKGDAACSMAIALSPQWSQSTEDSGYELFKDYRAIWGLTRLEHLKLSILRRCHLPFQLETDFYYTALKGMRFSLRSLDVSGHAWLDWNYATDFAKALTCLKHTLQHLTLMACLQNLPLESVTMIATAVSGLERLQSIDLSDNIISASSMGVLGPSLGCLHTTLRSLNLSYNRDLLSEDGASHVSDALIKLTGLTYLGMSEVSGLSAGVQQLRVLTPSLAALTKLECLNLICSAFLTEKITISVLAPALRQLSALTQLVVGYHFKHDKAHLVDLADNESSAVLAVMSEAILHMPACKLR
ncbi:hypothetical protein CEUSTIGMA_g6757.t1 [Chlamydomonas eustigma]|uniref:Uncharacterized protein n=1 Tax=Chlamydomonas eustigma TaxID=1157962 RepID=A0A250X8D3_9CHLO|nr:hypothetical protein CEUSTIGMA_g6757.t1 [Chlamydomonas eustigma]|eukprot:GAX79316.1 hypothetical protein CEUSTIGMA_g6757.t1 [Chlamydomonas eustigma]